MSYLLTKFQELSGLKYALKLECEHPQKGIQPYLLHATDHLLIFEHLNLDSLDQNYLKHCNTIVSGSGISAMVGLPRIGKKARFASLFDFMISVLEVLEYDFSQDTRLILEPSFFPDLLETDPILLLCSDLNYTYLVLYKHTGFISIFNLNTYDNRDGYGESSIPRLKRSRSDLHSTRTFSIGNIVVCLIAVSNGVSPVTLAVLYRDIDFNYSLRYYTLSPDLESIPMVHQMEHFSGTPSHVMSTGEGFLVASDVKLWFFPPLKKAVILADLAGDPLFPVSYNKHHNVVTLDMSVNKMTYLGSRFEVSTQIDKNRHLLISDTGNTLLVYLEVCSTSSTTTVNQFQVVDLGKSTIASSVVHLEDNLFYAGSQRSRSILFRILPQAPHIDILQYGHNASPILNMNLQEKRHKKSLLLARGGFHGGELEPVVGSLFKIEQSHLVRVSIEATRLSVPKIDGAKIVILRDHAGKTIHSLDYSDLIEIELPTNIVRETLNHREDMGCLEHLQSQNITRWQIDHERSIEYNIEGPTQITLKCETDISITIEALDQVSSLDWLDNGTSLDVYITLWNGTLVHLLFNEKGVKVIGNVSTGLQGKISFTRFTVDETQYRLVLLDGEGLVFHVLVLKENADSEPMWDLKESYYLKAPQGHGAFRMSVNEVGDILVHDSFSIFRLFERPQTIMNLQLRKLHTFNYQVRDCTLVDSNTDSGTLIVLFNDGNLRLYLFAECHNSLDSFSCDELILLSVNVSDRHAVALRLKTVPNPATGQMDTYLSLILFDRLSLKSLHLYKAPGESNFVDICVVNGKYTKNGQAYIVVANSVEDHQDMLKVFQVSRSKIEEVSSIPVNGILPKTFSLSKISCHKQKVLLAGDSFLSFTLESRNGHESWEGKTFVFDNTPFYGVDVAGNDNFCVFADAVRGLYMAMPESRKVAQFQLPSQFELSFGTAVTVLNTRPIFIYGDSMGNICACEKLDSGNVQAATNGFKTLFATNISEYINDIVVLLEDPLSILFATVKGNLYRVHNIEGYPLAQAHFETDKDVLSNVMATSKVSSNLLDGRRFFPKRTEGKSFPDRLLIEIAEIYGEVNLL